MTEDRFIRMPELVKMLGISQRSIYYLIQCRRFMPGISIGDRAVGWSHNQV